VATLRETIGLIITSCCRTKLIKIKGFVTSQRTFVARNIFPHVKVARNTKKVGQACHIPLTFLMTNNFMINHGYI